jgi:hypothetical protein
VVALVALRIARQPARKQGDKTGQAAEGEQDKAGLERGCVCV